MLDALHARLRASRFFARFTAFTRLLIGLGFIPPGLAKVLGQRFTQLPTTNSVGYFFDAFFQAEEFYVFVGLAQVTAGVLLLIPRTATLGAVVFAPIILNITVITWAIGFPGTRWITLLMTLATLYLLVWDYDRLKAILPLRLRRSGAFGGGEYARQAAFWASMGAVAYGAAVLVNLANVWERAGLLGLVVAAVAGALFGVLMATHVRRMPPLARPGSGAVVPSDSLPTL